MDTTHILLVIAFVVEAVLLLLLYHFWRTRPHERPAEADAPAVEPEREKAYGTVALLTEQVKALGGNLRSEPVGGGTRYHFVYQGEHFTVDATDTSPYIHIYDMAWYSAPLADIDNLSRVRQAVNATNLAAPATVVYTIDREENEVHVHTRQCMLLSSHVPDLETHLRSYLDDSFRQHHRFFRELESIRNGERAAREG